MVAADNERAAGTGRRWATVTAADVISTFARGIPPGGMGDGGGAPDGVIVLGAGNPDPATLPKAGLLAAAQRVLEQEGPSALFYGGTQGELAMREWLAERLNAQEDAGVTAENFLLTNGSGQAIELAIRTFMNPGDTMLVEWPTYSGGLRVFRAYGAQIEGVEMDAEGVCAEALEQTIARLSAAGRHPRLFYTMPTLHNPSGLTTSLARREAVVDICDRHGVLIVEDDAYGEIRVEGQRPPSYYKLAGGQGALRLSTMSKMLATGLRVGWVTGRKDLIDAMVKLRLDGGLSPFLVRTVAEFCISGDEDRHLETMIPVYREKRDRMLAALSERCARFVSWEVPEGGFFIWLKLADEVDSAKLVSAMAAENVAARPGTQFHHDGAGQDYLRLCFSTPSIEEIEEGIRRLGRALEAAAR